MDGLNKTCELVFVLVATNLPWELDVFLDSLDSFILFVLIRVLLVFVFCNVEI